MATERRHWDYSIETFEQALNIKREILQLETRLESLFGGAPQAATPRKSASSTEAGGAGSSSGKRSMSPAARQRIAQAQRARWARLKGSPAQPPASSRKVTSAKQSGISAAGRKRLSEMMKARWAARKKSAKSS